MVEPITRDEVDEIVRNYGDMPRMDLPRKYRDPRSERDFHLAFAIYMAGKPEVSPIYDEQDHLTGWQGVRLRYPPQMR